ncbi:hypothetical protein HMPREF0653_01323 [Prevotella disiens JCM 6334 = ATCC 29426]|uniref:Uncharacterized protein n=2 Tax=Prevotella disiens TaxID=28130 RepID=E1KQ66_9BACT|nr:hypothetical protein HMPREF9296_0929 [Prevotella disiens FB035-09AN]ERJ76955.1 hypothetical protein HMPREF0653_01323 [Prevotella disiens JCM 6334 = ATCC 29426]
MYSTLKEPVLERKTGSFKNASSWSCTKFHKFERIVWNKYRKLLEYYFCR